MQPISAHYVSVPPEDVGPDDIAMEGDAPRLSVERTIIDLVEELGRPGDLDAVIRTALRHRLTTQARLWRRSMCLAAEGNAHARAVLDSLVRIHPTSPEARGS